MQLMEEPQPTVRRRKPLLSRLLLLLLLVFILLALAILLLQKQPYGLGWVEMKNTSSLSEEEILRVAGIRKPVNVAALRTEVISARLNKDLRLDHIQVYRSFPATIHIVAEPRRSLAYIPWEYGFVCVDESGTVLAVLKDLKQEHLPMITGITIPNICVGEKVQNPAVGQAITYLAALDKETYNHLSEIHIQQEGTYLAYADNSIQFRLGPGVKMPEKALLTGQIFRDIEARKLSVLWVDIATTVPYIKLRV